MLCCAGAHAADNVEVPNPDMDLYPADREDWAAIELDEEDGEAVPETQQGIHHGFSQQGGEAQPYDEENNVNLSCPEAAEYHRNSTRFFEQPFGTSRVEVPGARLQLPRSTTLSMNSNVDAQYRSCSVTPSQDASQGRSTSSRCLQSDFYNTVVDLDSNEGIYSPRNRGLDLNALY